MRRGILVLIMGVCGCALQNGKSGSPNAGVVTLDFTQCSDSVIFRAIQLLPPKGYKLLKVDDHQFCEYRMVYEDRSILYISTNIYDGSNLNAENRYREGIITYSSNRSLYDTIRNSGKNGDRYWLEWINGTYVVGYVDVSDTATFHIAIKSINLGDQ